MPGDVTKKKGKGYRVTWGGKTTAKGTSKAKAESQLRLLRAVKHGWKPSKKYSGRRRKGTLLT